MMTNQFEGVILAGGKGSRMAPFSEHHPKPLLPICNRPVIEHQIDIMRSLGIRNVTILIGHKGYEISRVLGNGERLDVNIRYVEQTATLGIAHAVGCLEQYIERPFLLFLGDIFFVPNDIREMMALFAGQDGGAVLATKYEPNPAAIRKNYALKISEQGFVTRVIEKPRHIVNTLKGVGLYLFDLTMFDAIRRTPRTAMRDEYEITEAIQVLINDGYPVRASNCVEEDINLTTPADLLWCNLSVAKRISTSGSVIAASASVHPDAVVENCVIGPNVVISRPVALRNSLLFEKTVVDTETPVRNSILTPELHLDCDQGSSLKKVQWA